MLKRAIALCSCLLMQATLLAQPTPVATDVSRHEQRDTVVPDAAGTIQQQQYATGFSEAIKTLKEVEANHHEDEQRSRARAARIIIEQKLEKGEVRVGCIKFRGRTVGGLTNSDYIVAYQGQNYIVRAGNQRAVMHFHKNAVAMPGALAGLIVHECTHLVDRFIMPCPPPGATPAEVQQNESKQVGRREWPAYANEKEMCLAVQLTTSNPAYGQQAGERSDVVCDERDKAKKQIDC